MKNKSYFAAFMRSFGRRAPFIPYRVMAGVILAACFSVAIFARDAVRSFDPARSGIRACLSLRVLSDQVKSDPASVQVRELGGIGWLEGYVIDLENRDVILIGRRHPNWPYIHLDDLVVNMRNVWHRQPAPYCSLDPRPEDIRKTNQVSAEFSRAKGERQKQEALKRFKKAAGPQEVVIGGVPRNSRHAHIMIDADYHLKKLSQDLVIIPGVPSSLDINLRNAEQTIRKGGNPDRGLSMSRFWFHAADDHPAFQESDGIVWLDRCSVVVLTERQRAGSDGRLYDSSEDDPVSRTFAANLTKRFREVSHKVPVYAQLENLYRLNALLRAMYFQNAVNAAKLDIRFFLERYAYQAEYKMPDFMEGLSNSKELSGRERKGNRIQEYTLYAIVSGGVSMNMPVKKDRFIRSADTPLDRFRNAILSSRPSRDALMWTVSYNEK